MGIVLTLVTVKGCDDCAMAHNLAVELVSANAKLAIGLESIDVDRDPKAVVDRRASVHPTFLLDVDGREAARIAGTVSKRRLLQKVLPVLYPDESAAVAQLRRQLGSPTETFPRRALRGRVRQAEKVRLLRQVPLFESLTRRDLARIGRIVDEIHREADESITNEGDRGDEFFVVVEGGVAIERAGRRVAWLGPGECFGEMSLLDDQPRSATATTSAPTILLVIHRDDFDRMLAANPQLMRSLLTTLSQRLR